LQKNNHDIPHIRLVELSQKNHHGFTASFVGKRSRFPDIKRPSAEGGEGLTPYGLAFPESLPHSTCPRFTYCAVPDMSREKKLTDLILPNFFYRYKSILP
jgi:hypothetical protein